MLSQSFDTHYEIKHLISNGIPEAQAEAITDTIKRAQDLHLEQLATKKDLLETEVALRNEIAEVKAELKNDIAELKNEIAEVKAELKNDIAEIRGELKLIKWMLALVILVNVLPILKTLFTQF